MEGGATRCRGTELITWEQVRWFLAEDARYYVQARPKKPLLVQAREALRVGLRYRYPPYQYVKHGCFERDFECDPEDFLPPVLFDRLRSRLNAGADGELALDKARFARRMGDAGLPAVPDLFRVHRTGEITDPDGVDVTFDEMRARLDAGRHRELFVKPLHSGSGKGARRLSVRDGRLFHERRAVDRDELFRLLFAEAQHKNYLVQPRLTQHDLLAAIYPAAINSIRIDTMLLGDEVVHNAAKLRTGVAGSITDN
jgi:hypothetical protein